MKGLSKNCSDFRRCSNLSDHQLKIDCYRRSSVYMKHMVTTNRKSTGNIKEINRKEFEYNTIENQQHTREESKRIRKEQRTKKKI